MSGDKRKQGSLDLYVVTSKKKSGDPLLIEQLNRDRACDADSGERQTDLVVIPISREGSGMQNAVEVDVVDQYETTAVVDSRPDAHEIDIGYHLSLKTHLADDVKHRLLTDPFRPNKKYAFPERHDKNGAVRRFMHNWLLEHPFLSYSPFLEGAFCAACCLFSTSTANQSTGVFVRHPCSQFRHLKHFSSLVKAHFNSEIHRLASTRATDFIRAFENPLAGIDYRVDRQRNATIERNKAIVLSVIKVVVTCARQNIALRGHRGTL